MRGDLNENSSHRLMCFNTWSLDDSPVRGGHGTLEWEALLEAPHTSLDTPAFIAEVHFNFILSASCLWMECKLSAVACLLPCFPAKMVKDSYLSGTITLPPPPNPSFYNLL